MAKKKADLIVEIKMAAAVMNGFHERWNMKENHLFVHEQCELFHMDVIRTAHKWIMKIYTGDFKQYQKTRKLLPEETWRRYFLWGGFEDHEEMVLLRGHTHQVRSQLVRQTRPDFYKKGKANAAIKRKQKGKHETTAKGS